MEIFQFLACRLKHVEMITPTGDVDDQMELFVGGKNARIPSMLSSDEEIRP